MQARSAMIRVIGVGGGGCNAVDHMIAQGLDEVQFICANTDAQALGRSSADTKIILGAELTHGLGAGANPEVGRQAALEDEMQIRETLVGTDMLFITAGMGGGTGTGAAPVIAQIAKELGILTVAVVSTPFHFEGAVRMKIAMQGIEELKGYVNCLIVVPNNRLLSALGKNVSLIKAFEAGNEVLLGAVDAISGLIINPGFINLDFADVKTVMSIPGLAMMGTKEAATAHEAATSAIECPLLDNVEIKNAQGVLVNVTGGADMPLSEFEDVGHVLEGFVNPQATVVIGTVIDPEMKDKIRVTIVITGIEENRKMDRAPITTPHRQAAQTAYEQPAYLRPRSSQQPAFAPNLTQHETLAAHVAEEAHAASTPDDELGYLNIPAFLRRKDKKTTA